MDAFPQTKRASLRESRARPAPRHWCAPALRGAAPAAAFRAVLHEALAQIEANARGVRASDDPEFLHQLRVGLRRLRAALRAFRGILEPQDAKRVRRALRELSPKLGRARDWDVLVQRLEATHATALLRRGKEKRDKARQSARRAIESKAFARLVAEARALAVEESRESLAQFGAAALDRAHRKLLKLGKIDWRDAAARHALRIRVKRLRYTCEDLAPAFAAERASPYVAALKALQEILGELNDIAVGRRLIGFDADETALLRRLERAWIRFAKRPVFWPAPR